MAPGGGAPSVAMARADMPWSAMARAPWQSGAAVLSFAWPAGERWAPSVGSPRAPGLASPGKSAVRSKPVKGHGGWGSMGRRSF